MDAESGSGLTEMEQVVKQQSQTDSWRLGMNLTEEEWAGSLMKSSNQEGWINFDIRRIELTHGE